MCVPACAHLGTTAKTLSVSEKLPPSVGSGKNAKGQIEKIARIKPS